MTTPHSSLHPGPHQVYPLRIQNTIRAVESQGLSPCSSAMAQQYKLMPATSMRIDTAVLQPMDVPSEKIPPPKPAMWQGAMADQGQHNQEQQESGPLMPSPVQEREIPMSAEAWTRSIRHRRLRPGGAPRALGYRRLRACNGQLQMMSTWRFPDHQGNQPQEDLSSHSARHRVNRAMASYRSGVPGSPGAQARNTENGGWLQRPQGQRIPLALQPRLPSIRSLIPELPKSFAGLTETSTVHEPVYDRAKRPE